MPRPLHPLICAVLASWTLASQAGQSAALTLDDALGLAVAEHPSVASRRSEQDAAQARLDSAQRQRFPNLIVQSGEDARGDRVSTYRLEQNLWTGGRITGEIAGAGARTRSADAALLLAQQEIMARVITAFTELGRARARQEVATANVSEHERLAELIARRVENQVSPSSDATLGRARLAQARAELDQLLSQEARARSTLSQITAYPVEAIEPLPRRDFGGERLDRLVEAALDYSPALQRLAAEIEALEADVTVRSSANWPEVKLRADRTVGGPTPDTHVYVALEYQTGAGFAAIPQVREAMARVDALRLARDATRRDTTDMVTADWADLHALRLQAANLRAQVESSSEVYESFVRQYAVGRKGWIDVLNAQRDLAQARNQQADTEWGRLRAILELQLATGQLGARASAPAATTTTYGDTDTKTREDAR